MFHANLYPIAKPGTGVWPEHYPELFGFESQLAYKNHVRDMRIALLARLIEDARPQAVVCLGKEGWPEFEKLLELGGLEPDPSSTSEVRAFSSKRPRAVLAAHPSMGHLPGHLSGEQADEISKLLASWRVSLP